MEAIDQWVVEGESYRLVVYEFGDGPTATPLVVMKDRVVDGVHKMIPVVVFDQEDPEWSNIIRQLKKR